MLSLQDALLRCSTRKRNMWRHHAPTRTRIFFGSRVMRFSGDPSQSSSGSYVLFFQGSHMQEQYHQWTTLRTWNPNSCSKIWRPLGLTLRCMPYGRGTLRSRCKGFRSKEGPHYCFMCSARNIEHDNQPNSRVGNPLEIPSRAVLRSLVGLMSCKEVSVWGFLWVRKVWFAFAQWTFAPETFGKRQKLSYFKKSCMLCMKFGGARMTYYLAVPKVRETGQKIGFLYSQQRAQ
jgi:hypothetical protein